MKTGTIVSHFGVKVLVEGEAQQRATFHVARNSGHVVGDLVEINDDRLKRLERKNSLVRKLVTTTQILAANLDAAGIVTTILPKTPETFIDRTVVACLKEHIQPFIVVNKSDLAGSKEYHEELKDRFAPALDLFLVSAANKSGLVDLRRHLALVGRSALIGVSGAGKSSLINALLPHARLAVGDMQNHKHGKHVTTVSNLFHLPEGGELVDTPGVRHFEPADIKPLELAHLFVGFEDALRQPCKFRDCLHLNEPNCSIRNAVAKGEVKRDRYDRYVELLRTL